MRLLAIVLALVSFTACEKKQEESRAPASPAAGDSKPPAPKKAEPDQAKPKDGEGKAGSLGLVVVDSSDSVVDTVARIQKDIEGAGLITMAVIDHGANAKKVGLELPATQLIIFGKPEVGTKLMQAKRTVAIDLPQKMLIWDEGGKTKVAYNDPKVLLARHGAEVPAPMVAKISGLLSKLASGGEQ